MLINGMNLSSLGIKLYDRVISSNQVDTTQEWLDGDIQPTFVRQQDRFKTITLTFLLLEPDEDSAFVKTSKLTQMLKKATLAFDDLSYTFDVTLRGQARTERLKNGNFLVTYTLDSDYAKGEREVYTTNVTATSTFKLTVLYYQNSTILLGREVIPIRAGAFTGNNDTLASLGIDVNKYQPDYYQAGAASNLGRMQLTYENLQSLNTLIINYAPLKYNITVTYWLDNGTGYAPMMDRQFSFTVPQLREVRTIGQLIDTASFRPEGYKAIIDYSGDIEVSALLAASPIRVRYDRVENDVMKNITTVYRREMDDGTFEVINSRIQNVTSAMITPGMVLSDVINLDLYNPNVLYYQEGQISEHVSTELISYSDLETTYIVNYRRRETTIYVEYYAGTYPDWYRLAITPVHLTWKDSYADNFTVDDLDLDLDRYHTSEYVSGALVSAELLTSYDEIVNRGVLQVYYVPIDFPLEVRYYVGDATEYETATYTINALQFFNAPVLSDIVDVLRYRPEGYQLDLDNSYSGEVSLVALTYASPITIAYKEITQTRTKNVIVKYRVEMASGYSTLNTSIILIDEANVVGGVRLRDIIDVNAYRPQYYDGGYLNNASLTDLIYYDDIEANYEVIYRPTEYTLPVYYYTDDVDENNWVGSDSLSYTVNSFTAETTLYDLGLDLNKFKNSFVDNGELQYNGMITFGALQALDKIDVVYMTVQEPDDEETINYPHRILFTQHNALGSYEYQHPEWTLAHSFINTGVRDVYMDELEVVMDCYIVDENVPLHTVNAGLSYLFGSSGPHGSYFMRFNNQTMYGENLSGINMYEAKAGSNSNPVLLTETEAIGWSSNSGIYRHSSSGYSRAVFTYSSMLPAEHVRLDNPLYLFAININGRPEGWLAGVGIKSCQIRINGVLVRDFIPVQFYDKIGTQIAPSDCLYDKISKKFFEDANGSNITSFNIMDDESYIDNDPAHQIGSCYVHYRKDGAVFQSRQVFFRGDDFDNEIDLFDFLAVDYYQPAYHTAGEITNLASLSEISFNALNGFTFLVDYTALNNIITVNYYHDSEAPENLITSEQISLRERDFYQVPTFGDLVRINKYKPDGYATNFEYQGTKVTLSRMMEQAPFNIVYTPIEGTEETYTTTIRYIKKVYGLRTYETIGTLTLTLGESDFRDGEYIEYYIDYNYMKPANYYKDGIPYEWYEHDLRLTTPDNLRSEYIIVYTPKPENVEIRYYTDDIDEANLVATANWTIQIDEFDGQFYIVDQMPNSYINKFKPINAEGGHVQNTDVLYTFTSLMEYGHIDILYMSLTEPDDPTNMSHIGKMLYWTQQECPARLVHYMSSGKGGGYYMMNGGCIPYIDLGYTPKEIGRLKVEIKGYFQGDGFQADTSPYGFQSPDYHFSFGYYGAAGGAHLGFADSEGKTLKENYGIAYEKYGPKYSASSTGCFAIMGHTPEAKWGVYSDAGPIALDGQSWFNTNNNNGTVTMDATTPQYASMTGIYRKGISEDFDDNYEPFRAYNTYGYTREIAYGDYVSRYAVVNDTSGEGHLEISKFVADPIIYTLDAYHGYAAAYDWGNSNLLTYVNFNESGDTDTWEGRCRPKGSLTLFRTRHPDTGEMNIMPFNAKTYPLISGGIGTSGWSASALENMLNPFSEYYVGAISNEVWVPIAQEDVQQAQQENADITQVGNTYYQKMTRTINIAYSDFPCPVYYQDAFGAVWGIKIWDQDRLVRDMIPVRAGESIYGHLIEEDGLFDLVTEILFTNANEGGTYTMDYYLKSSGSSFGELISDSMTIRPEDVCPLHCVDDPCYWGKITENYYDEENHFIANQYVDVPTWFYPANSTLENELQYNDYKPDDYHLDGILDTDDPDDNHTHWGLYEIYEQGAINIYYKLRTFSKSVLYYQDNYRIGSQDLFYTLKDIEDAHNLNGLHINPNLYQDLDHFAAGRVVFNQDLIANHDMEGFINAPSPVVVYDKYDSNDHPELLYLEYYRGGAYDDVNAPVTLDPDNNNYLICNLSARVLNPNGAIKYSDHYHQALYEDETLDYFIPYQVRVVNPYTGIHYGPARRYKNLATIATSDIYTIDEVRNGWGRLREYQHGWIDLSATEVVVGPGQNPDYDSPGDETATIPFGSTITITKLTVDRLWAWVPAQESWVKTEEISFSQAGKLYNALGIDVIDLSLVDWSNVSSLNDLDINPNKYRLQYHDINTYTYTGTYDYSSFSAIHELDFVYPETVYTYICKYFKNHPSDVQADELGRSMFTCTISDWTPDWDHFIETSWRYNDQNQLLLPELYREAPITLTWDYFGFDKNLYKPTGWGDGVYVWNPHPWDEEHLFFSFDELVRTGDQEVFYPFMDPHTYKFWSTSRPSGGPHDASHRMTLSGKYNDYVLEFEDPMLTTGFPDQYTGLWKAELPSYAASFNEITFNEQSHYNAAYESGMNRYNQKLYYYISPWTDGGSSKMTQSISFYPDATQRYLDTHSSYASQYGTGQRDQRFVDQVIDAGLYDLMKYNSNDYHRLYVSLTNPYGYLFMATIPYANGGEPVYAIHHNQYETDQAVYDSMPDGWSRIYPQHSSFYQENANFTLNETQQDSGKIYPHVGAGIYHGIRTYAQSRLKNYFIPVPAGLPYEYDGVNRRNTYAGMLDLFTNELIHPDGEAFLYNTRAQYGQNPKSLTYDAWEAWEFTTTQFSYTRMYEVTAPNGIDVYEYPSIYSRVKAHIANGVIIPLDGYTNDHANGVSGTWYKNDFGWVRYAVNNNNVYTIQRNNSYDQGGTGSTITIVKQKSTAVIMKDTVNSGTSHWNEFKRPNDYTSSSTTEHSQFSAWTTADVPPFTTYYLWDAPVRDAGMGDGWIHNYFLFTGTIWIDLEETHLVTTEDKELLILHDDYLSYYELPIASDNYKLGEFMAGDRVWKTAYSTRDPMWAVSDAGWFRIDNHFSQ